MRLAEMVLREDFDNILKDSVIAYYHRVYGRNILFSYQKEIDCEPLLINGKLGFISRFPAPTGLRKFLLAEYNVRGNFLKYLAGKVAAMLIGTLPQVGKLKNAYITAGILGKNTFISPQNRAIRFFDYDAMTVDCIIKVGFTDKYFTRQLIFRKQYSYDFMLPLLESGDGWFREPILTGHPLARVTDDTKYRQGVEDALRGIGLLAADTLSYESSEEYAQHLFGHIEELLRDAEYRKHSSFTQQTLHMAAQAVETIKMHPMQIPVCMSHGDFQGGNIWVDDIGKTWIYDWETVDRRSVWYDSAVLRYALRRAYGWQNLLNEETPDVLACDPEKNRSAEEWKTIKAVILMEDIVFYLEDMLELPEDWGVQIYDEYIQRMATLLLPKEERK